ncbi:hypothetical protein K438DRAFT_2155471 [Mycena galopus ATCC 62051]|nr:hypothetical protein K438DRAFT_2155471 [Mycena galopus ATCC 62051]
MELSLYATEAGSTEGTQPRTRGKSSTQQAARLPSLQRWHLNPATSTKAPSRTPDCDHRTAILSLTMDRTPSAVSDSASCLPPELECAIFEIAALSRRTSIPNLVLVAARKSLGFPLFRVEILLRVIASKPLQFLQHSVQHLFLEDRTTQQELIIICSACGVWRSLGLDDLSLIDDGRSVLPKITHLELLNPAETFDNLLPLLPLMRFLTHIALNYIPGEGKVLTALRKCGNLSCIIFLTEADDPPLDDDQFVCLQQGIPFRESWLYGADTGRDYWEVADAFLAARQEGRVDYARYRISDADTSWRN